MDYSIDSMVEEKGREQETPHFVVGVVVVAVTVCIRHSLHEELEPGSLAQPLAKDSFRTEIW